MNTSLAALITGLLGYLIDYLILNPEIFLNWNSFRSGIIAALLAFLGKNRKKIIAAIKGLLK